MLRKKTRHFIALFTAVMLVWGQLMVAAYACPQLVAPESQPAMMESGMMMAGCTQMEQKDESSSALCKAHCEQSPQVTSVSSLDMPPLTLVAILEVPHFYSAGIQSGQSLYSNLPLAVNGSPPLRIQFQVFRI